MASFESWQSSIWEDTLYVVISGSQLKTEIYSQVVHIIMLYLFICQILLAKTTYKCEYNSSTELLRELTVIQVQLIQDM